MLPQIFHSSYFETETLELCICIQMYLYIVYVCIYSPPRLGTNMAIISEKMDLVFHSLCDSADVCERSFQPFCVSWLIISIFN